MHRRAAALLLCGPLVAGCGTAARLRFAGHSRPAAPLEVSVYVGSSGIRVDPRTLTPGPVQLDITNRSGRTVTVALVTGGGHTLSSSPSIPAGATALLKTRLGSGRVAVALAGHTASAGRLTLAGGPRTGDGSLLLP